MHFNQQVDYAAPLMGRGVFVYLRLTNRGSEQLYAEGTLAPSLAAMCQRLLELGWKAASFGGTLKRAGDTQRFCERCKEPTAQRALVDRPHGLEGAEMEGTRRRVCLRCGNEVYREASEM